MGATTSHPAQAVGEAADGDLVTDLERPEAYPPPRPRSVQLATTHASWVFLTDGEAWKVKRPVSFGFLEYSAPEKRRRCCEDEVRLGARLAEDVYLGVHPIHRGPRGHTLVGPGEVVDHAVRMRRLPDEDRALALLQRGALAPAHLAHLAERLADFYARTPATPAMGEPAPFAANVAENYLQTRPYFDHFVDGRLAGEVDRWQDGQLAACEPLLRARMTAERIRDGHGDLRLEHVYFAGGAPERVRVIDPIEFNASFRCIDVALDVAFLAMELEGHGRADLATHFLSCFARAADDYDFYPLLPLYCSYRAWVRAKVACFVAGDAATPPDESRRKAAEAARLIALAASYRAPPRGARAVVVVAGEIGTGKSTLAAALAPALLVPVVSSDWTRKHLAGIAPRARGGAALYGAELTRATYARMQRHARSVLEAGRGVILDATFRDPADRLAARRLAVERERPFLFVVLEADRQTVAERLRRRSAGPSVSDADPALLGRLGRWPPARDLPPHERLVLDARRPVRELVAAVSARLRSTAQ